MNITTDRVCLSPLRRIRIIRERLLYPLLGETERRLVPGSIHEEQLFVDDTHRRLDEFIDHLNLRIDETTAAPGTGTGQDEIEREALLENLNQQLHAAQAARARVCFGRLRYANGADHHVGRIGLRDDDGEVVLLDWRAPQSAPFYQATFKDPMGLSLRRRIAMKRDDSGPHVTHVDDETFDAEATQPSAGAVSMDAPRSGRMADILATIAADQDAIIRSPLDQVTVVQGGPGTGKTVVALHRAAWLLYTHRERLSRDGVLIVGPSRVFLQYIDQVLPSLGETDVVLLTPDQLYPHIRTHHKDAREASRIKGDERMSGVLANAIAARVRIPGHGLHFRTTTGMSIDLSREEIENATRGISRSRNFHEGRDPFLRRVLMAAARNLARATGHDPEDEDYCNDLVASLVEDQNVRREFNLMWLPTTAEKVVSSILSNAPALSSAAEGILTPAEQQTILRATDSPWTTDDLPLLDEVADLLGPWTPPSARNAEPSEYRELEASDAYRISPSRRSSPRSSIAERAIDDREWVYGHVIVDEAQELSAMAWRAIRRRASRKSMTVVGDLQQSSHPAGPRTWEQALSWTRSSMTVHTLTITYRITRQIAEAATDLLISAGGDPPILTPIRDGEPVVRRNIRLDELPEYAKVTGPRDGRNAVVAPDARIDELRNLLVGSEFGFDDQALDAPIAVITAQQSKGLEFDCVLLLDPGELSAQHVHGADVYVAATRATQELHILTLR